MRSGVSRKAQESQRPADLGQVASFSAMSADTFAMFTWDRSVTPTPAPVGTPVPPIAGYKLSYGTQSGIYSQVLDVGNTTTATAVNLIPGVLYFFGASAYDSAGNSSAFSNEVTYRPATPTPGPPTPVPTAGPPTPTKSPSPVPTASPTPGPCASGICLNPASLTFNSVPGQQNVPSKTVIVMTSSGVNWSAHDTSTHFDAQPQAGGPSGTLLTVKLNNGLAAGTYTDQITFSASGLPSKQFTVTMIVSNASSPTPAKTPSPAPSPTPVKTPSPAPTASPSPSASPSATPSPSPSVAPSPSPSVSPAPSPSPSCSPCNCR